MKKILSIVGLLFFALAVFGQPSTIFKKLESQSILTITEGQKDTTIFYTKFDSDGDGVYEVYQLPYRTLESAVRVGLVDTFNSQVIKGTKTFTDRTVFSKLSSNVSLYENGQYNGWFNISQDVSDGWSIGGGFDMRDATNPYEFKSSGLRLAAHLINPSLNDTINPVPLITAMVTSDNFSGENWLGNAERIVKTPLFGVGIYGSDYQFKVWADSTKIYNNLFIDKKVTIKEALTLESRSTLPTTPSSGQMVVYNGTGTEELYIYLNGNWNKIQ